MWQLSGFVSPQRSSGLRKPEPSISGCKKVRLIFTPEGNNFVIWAHDSLTSVVSPKPVNHKDVLATVLLL